MGHGVTKYLHPLPVTLVKLDSLTSVPKHNLSDTSIIGGREIPRRV